MKNKSYVANFTMDVGGKMTTVGSLFTIRATLSKYSLCTPDYEKVRQVYIDNEDNIYEKWQLVRGIEQKDGSFEPVGDNDDIEDARTSTLPNNHITLSAHSAREVNQEIFPSANQGYFFEVLKDKKGNYDPFHLKNYRLIKLLLETPDLALIGRCNLSHNEGLCRLGLFRDQIFLQKQLSPEELNHYDFPPFEAPTALARAASQVAPKLIRGFDPNDYRNNIADRLLAVAMGHSVAAPVDEFDDLMAALEELALV